MNNDKENSFGEKLSKVVEYYYLHFPFSKEFSLALNRWCLKTWDKLQYKVFGKPTTGQEAFIGEFGKVESISEVNGQTVYYVEFEGERWRFQSEDDLNIGDRIEIMGTNGLALNGRKQKLKFNS